MKKIFFAIPTRTGTLEWPAVRSLMQSHAACRDRDWKTVHEFLVGDSSIANARNLLVAKFLQTDCTDMFWADDDNGWTKQGFVDLIGYREDFVCMAYRHKTDDAETYSVEPTKLVPNDNGLLAVAHCGLGAAKMSRGMIEHMTRAYPQTYAFPGLPDLTTYALFENGYRGGQMDGEDVCFCKKWRAIGGTVWIDPKQQTEHMGKKSYVGNYSAAVPVTAEHKPNGNEKS